MPGEPPVEAEVLPAPTLMAGTTGALETEGGGETAGEVQGIAETPAPQLAPLPFIPKPQQKLPGDAGRLASTLAFILADTTDPSQNDVLA